LVPVNVTDVLPTVEPLFGLTPVTVGTTTYVKASPGEGNDVPNGAVTVTSTVPTDPAGDVAVICESDITVNDSAETPPNDTADASVNPEPVIVTGVPPARGPAGGETDDTVGADR
jgi:hypothetical protein